MAVFDLSAEQAASARLSPLRPAPPLPRLVQSIAVTLVVAQAVFLAGSYLKGTWLVAPGGGGVEADFVNVWAAGKLTLSGHPALAYDWPTHKLAEVAALGHPFDGYYGWHYPPTFLFVAAALALLPYAAAFLIWTVATFLPYLVAVRTIIGDRVGYLLAAAFPAVVANFFVGQNGFLSAALLGGALVLIERRQTLLAGVLIGLLAYKPHLGLLIPVALIAGGAWRTIATAAIVAALIAAAAWLSFGTESWLGFLGHIGQSSQAVFADGKADWGKLQTAFGAVRTLGGSETLAWATQGLVALLTAAAVAALWRSDAAFEIKAAALGTGALLATPYLYMYDLAVLAVPLAFLIRLGRTQGFRDDGFRDYELASIGIACALMLAFIVPFLKVPLGFAAVLIVAALIARRVLAPRAFLARA
jgi:arabinofuranan 3-O-arabinosyltransferase